MNDGPPMPPRIANKAATQARAIARIVMPMYWRGASLQAIADALNAAGIRTVQGKAWYPTQVRRVIGQLTK